MIEHVLPKEIRGVLNKFNRTAFDPYPMLFSAPTPKSTINFQTQGERVKRAEPQRKNGSGFGTNTCVIICSATYFPLRRAF